MKRILPLLSLLFLLSACGGPKAFYDYDRQIDFNQFQTFAFFDDMKTGLNELDEERVEEALTHQLDSLGIQFSETPDFYINYYSEVFEKQGTSIGLGIGGGGGAVGGGVSGGIPVGGNKLFMSLTLEFVNATDNELFWQAVIENRYNQDAKPEERTLCFEEIVGKALENYPPEE
jgi:hypothetical protein